MKKIFDKEKLKSHNGIIFVCVVALVCCIGVVNGKLSEKGALGVSAGYEDYENEEMAAHSGDVLVDSLNLSAAEGSSSDAAQNGDKAGGDSTADKDAAGAASGEKTETVTSDDASSVAGSDEFFKEARETLAYDRNEMISVLTDTIDNAGEGSEKNSAKEQKDKIIKYMDMEKSLENLIRSKGYSDAFVIVTDKSVNVTVQADSIDDQDAARILDIVMRETGRNADGIVVQAKRLRARNLHRCKTAPDLLSYITEKFPGGWRRDPGGAGTAFDAGCRKETRL